MSPQTMSCTVLLIGLLSIVAADQQSFDCPMRQLGMEFSAMVQPNIGAAKLQEVADALNGSPEKTPGCNVTVPSDAAERPRFGKVPLPLLRNSYYVHAVKGDDKSVGSEGAPFQTIERAIEATRHNGGESTIVLREGTFYLPKTIHLGAGDSGLQFQSYPGEEAWVSGGVPLTGVTWTSAKGSGDAPVVYTANLATFQLPTVKGLRVFGGRAIRARFPNADPELGFGSSLRATSWTVPTGDFNPDQLFRPEDPFRNSSYSFQYYDLGIGGQWCSGPLAFDPPAGYWCSNFTEGGGPAAYRTPPGMTATTSVLPNQPYADPAGAVIQAWHPGHWASRMYLVDETGYSYDSSSSTGTFNFARGGFQDGRGSNDAGEFYVENVYEELDSLNEWFYNETTQTLYFAYNGTGTPPTNGTVVAISDMQVLFNITASQEEPAFGISFNGVGFRDTAYSYFEAHTIPSGGDWGLARTGSVFAEGTEGFTVSNCVFERLDNHAVTLSGYHRNATISDNEFVWLGESAIVLWGKTDGAPVETFGFDATAGNQPRYTTISGNFAHELGIWEKQSSFVFQGKSCLNTIENNIFFNGPRAGVNFNDGLGGGSVLKGNFLFNTCRESGDHGPFNSWDRQVYVTEWGMVKLYDTITNNFMIANYNSQEAVDNDDGSAYYETYENFLVYSSSGMKSDFGGHDNHHHDNVYAYVGQGYTITPAASQLEGHEDHFYNNVLVQTQDGDYGYGEACNPPGKTVFYNNSIFSPTGAITECGVTLAQWQAQGNDPNTTATAGFPSDEQLLQWARDVLGL